MIEHKTTHNTEALARLAEFIKGKPNIAALLNVFTLSVQDLEDTEFSLFTDRILPNAVGEQLNVIGRIVGQPRLEADDPTYRLRLAARIAANRSRGVPGDIYRVFFALLGSAAELQIIPEFPAGFDLRINNPAVDPAVVPLLSGFLKDSRGAGIRAILEWFETSETDTFSFALSATLTEVLTGPVAGATVGVSTTVGFPDSGTLRFFEGLANEFSASYTGKTPVHFTGVTVVGVHTAGIGDLFILFESIDNGFSDSGDTSVGGAFSGAIES